MLMLGMIRGKIKTLSLKTRRRRKKSGKIPRNDDRKQAKKQVVEREFFKMFK